MTRPTLARPPSSPRLAVRALVGEHGPEIVAPAGQAVRNATADQAAADSVDITPVQAAWAAARDELLVRWADVRDAQLDELADQITDALADGEPERLATLTASSVAGAELLAAAMVELAAGAGGQVVAEAAAQGAVIGAAAPSAAELGLVASTAAALLAASLALAAGREALRLRRTGKPRAVADDVVSAIKLGSMEPTGAVGKEIGAALTHAQNGGRIHTLRSAPEAALYASEKNDRNTCKPCKEAHGRWLGNSDGIDFEMLDKTYPYSGYVHCLGGDRCRGTVVGVWRSKTVDDSVDTVDNPRMEATVGGWMERPTLRMARPVAALKQGVRDWYRIENLGSLAKVYIYDEIGYFGVSAIDFVAALELISSATIEVHISSPGGDVWDGIAIYQALRNHDARIVVHVDSLAASAASFIAQAGDEIIMGRNAEMMIHEAMGICLGNAADMAEMIARLDTVSDNIASIYAERSGKGDAASWREAMRVETWYGAAEALAAGLVDTVAEPEPRKRDDSATDKWNMSVFAYGNRESAPAPAIPANVPVAVPVVVPDQSAWDAQLGNTLASALQNAFSPRVEAVKCPQ